MVVVVGPTPPPENDGGVQQPFLRTPADGIPLSNRNPDLLVDWWPPSIRPAGGPTSTGAVHKSVTCSCVSMFGRS